MTTLDTLRAIGPFPGVIQIVPTLADLDLLSPRGGEAGREVASGSLTYHGGRTIVGGAVALVYLDTFPDSESDFTAFVQAITQNGYYVSPDGKDTAGSKFLGAFHVSSGLIGIAKDSQLQRIVNRNIGLGLPANDGSTLYMLVLPAGLQVTFDDGSGSSCSNFCGYHSRTTASHYYAVICDPSCAACHGNLSPQAARQMIASHEYGEWRSDPDGTGWYEDATGMENGDKCAWEPVPWGPSLQWTVQPLFVNGQGCADLPAYQPSSQPQPLKLLQVSGPTAPTAGQPGVFAAVASGGTPPYSYAWDFGDGSRLGEAAASVQHTYQAAGTYQVAVQVLDANAQTASSAPFAVVVTAAPQPNPTDRFWKWLALDADWALGEPEAQRAQQAAIVRQTLDQFYPRASGILAPPPRPASPSLPGKGPGVRS